MERNVASLAIVLHSQRYGQLNRRLRLLSVDWGIIDVIGYGARKASRTAKAEVFTDGQFFLYYNPVKKDYTLKDLQVVNDHEMLKGDLYRTYAAHLFCELILVTNGGESAKTYRLLSTALDLLGSMDIEADLVLIQFIYRLIDVLGLRTDLTRCPVCDRIYGEHEVLSFSTSLGCPCCSECSSLQAVLPLPPGARRYLVYTADMDFVHSMQVQLSETARLRIKDYMLWYARIIAGNPLKTLSSGILQMGVQQ